jgi:hypothetical protein
MTLTSHRFYDIIIRIFQARLLNAASLKDHKLILECFHPSTKLSSPYLFCDYLGTGSCDAPEDEASIFQNLQGTDRLGQLKGLYSHFRPLLPDEDRKARRSLATGGWAYSPFNALVQKETEYVCQNLHLESHELFSQLCTITNLVKVGPKRGLFLSCVNIGDSVTRIWRDWLAERCASLAKRNRLGSGPNTKKGEDEEFKKRLLWADAEEHVGLRIRVIEDESVPAPVLVSLDEDAPVSYTLQYEGSSKLTIARQLY